MNKRILRYLCGITLVLIIAFSSTAFQVHEQQDVVVVTRFGGIKEIVTKPGLYFKWPWPFEKANRFDTRPRLLNVKMTQVTTKDQRPMIFESYAIWKISDAEKFMRRAGEVDEMERLLSDYVTTAYRSVIGTIDYDSLISTDAQKHRDDIEKNITAHVEKDIAGTFGIVLLQAGFRRIALPEENTGAMLKKMISGRKLESARYRSDGERRKVEIEADTTAAVSDLTSAAEKRANITKAKADAEAERIYAEAHKKNPEFYKFIRSVEALEHILRQKARLILSTDDAPFKVLKDMK